METIMMTLEKPKLVSYTYSSSELSNRVNETIEKVENWIKENNYRISKPTYRVEAKCFYPLSKNQEKKINKIILSLLNKKITIRKSNYFFHLLSKILGYEKIYIKVSEKEEAIQNARKKMKALKSLYEQALIEYKTEKGDFYKFK